MHTGGRKLFYVCCFIETLFETLKVCAYVHIIDFNQEIAAVNQRSLVCVQLFNWTHAHAFSFPVFLAAYGRSFFCWI